MTAGSYLGVEREVIVRLTLADDLSNRLDEKISNAKKRLERFAADSNKTMAAATSVSTATAREDNLARHALSAGKATEAVTAYTRSSEQLQQALLNESKALREAAASWDVLTAAINRATAARQAWNRASASGGGFGPPTGGSGGHGGGGGGAPQLPFGGVIRGQPPQIRGYLPPPSRETTQQRVRSNETASNLHDMYREMRAMRRDFQKAVDLGATHFTPAGVPYQQHTRGAGGRFLPADKRYFTATNIETGTRGRRVARGKEPANLIPRDTYAKRVPPAGDPNLERVVDTLERGLAKLGARNRLTFENAPPVAPTRTARRSGAEAQVDLRNRRSYSSPSRADDILARLAAFDTGVKEPSSRRQRVATTTRRRPSPAAGLKKVPYDAYTGELGVDPRSVRHRITGETLTHTGTRGTVSLKTESTRSFRPAGVPYRITVKERVPTGQKADITRYKFFTQDGKQVPRHQLAYDPNFAADERAGAIGQNIGALQRLEGQVQSYLQSYLRDIQRGVVDVVRGQGDDWQSLGRANLSGIIQQYFGNRQVLGRAVGDEPFPLNHPVRAIRLQNILPSDVQRQLVVPDYIAYDEAVQLGTNALGAGGAGVTPESIQSEARRLYDAALAKATAAAPNPAIRQKLLNTITQRGVQHYAAEATTNLEAEMEAVGNQIGKQVYETELSHNKTLQNLSDSALARHGFADVTSRRFDSIEAEIENAIRTGGRIPTNLVESLYADPTKFPHLTAPYAGLAGTARGFTNNDLIQHAVNQAGLAVHPGGELAIIDPTTGEFYSRSGADAARLSARYNFPSGHITGNNWFSARTIHENAILDNEVIDRIARGQSISSQEIERFTGRVIEAGDNPQQILEDYLRQSSGALGIRSNPALDRWSALDVVHDEALLQNEIFNQARAIVDSATAGAVISDAAAFQSAIDTFNQRFPGSTFDTSGIVATRRAVTAPQDVPSLLDLVHGIALDDDVLRTTVNRRLEELAQEPQRRRAANDAKLTATEERRLLSNPRRGEIVNENGRIQFAPNERGGVYRFQVGAPVGGRRQDLGHITDNAISNAINKFGDKATTTLNEGTRILAAAERENALRRFVAGASLDTIVSSITKPNAKRRTNQTIGTFLTDDEELFLSSAAKRLRESGVDSATAPIAAEGELRSHIQRTIIDPIIARNRELRDNLARAEGYVPPPPIPSPWTGVGAVQPGQTGITGGSSRGNYLYAPAGLGLYSGASRPGSAADAEKIRQDRLARHAAERDRDYYKLSGSVGYPSTRGLIEPDTPLHVRKPLYIAPGGYRNAIVPTAEQRALVVASQGEQVESARQSLRDRAYSRLFNRITEAHRTLAGAGREAPVGTSLPLLLREARLINEASGQQVIRTARRTGAEAQVDLSKRRSYSSPEQFSSGQLYDNQGRPVTIDRLGRPRAGGRLISPESIRDISDVQRFGYREAFRRQALGWRSGFAQLPSGSRGDLTKGLPQHLPFDPYDPANADRLSQFRREYEAGKRVGQATTDAATQSLGAVPPVAASNQKQTANAEQLRQENEAARRRRREQFAEQGRATGEARQQRQQQQRRSAEQQAFDRYNAFTPRQQWLFSRAYASQYPHTGAPRSADWFDNRIRHYGLRESLSRVALRGRGNNTQFLRQARNILAQQYGSSPSAFSSWGLSHSEIQRVLPQARQEVRERLAGRADFYNTARIEARYARDFSQHYGRRVGQDAYNQIRREILSSRDSLHEANQRVRDARTAPDRDAAQRRAAGERIRFAQLTREFGEVRKINRLINERVNSEKRATAEVKRQEQERRRSRGRYGGVSSVGYGAGVLLSSVGGGPISGVAGGLIQAAATVSNPYLFSYALAQVGTSFVQLLSESNRLKGTDLAFRNITTNALGAGVGDTLIDSLNLRFGSIATESDLKEFANSVIAIDAATSAKDVERLAEVGLGLGKAFGRTPDEAIRSFSLLLSNESIRRLDTFGISAIQVRDRIAEIRKELPDISRSEAFYIAFDEAAAISLQKVGGVEGNVTHADAAGVLIARASEEVIKTIAPTEAIGKLITAFNDPAAFRRRSVAQALAADPVAQLHISRAAADISGYSIPEVIGTTDVPFFERTADESQEDLSKILDSYFGAYDKRQKGILNSFGTLEGYLFEPLTVPEREFSLNPFFSREQLTASDQAVIDRYRDSAIEAYKRISSGSNRDIAEDVRDYDELYRYRLIRSEFAATGGDAHRAIDVPYTPLYQQQTDYSYNTLARISSGFTLAETEKDLLRAYNTIKFLEDSGIRGSDGFNKFLSADEGIRELYGAGFVNDNLIADIQERISAGSILIQQASEEHILRGGSGLSLGAAGDYVEQLQGKQTESLQRALEALPTASSASVLQLLSNFGAKPTSFTNSVLERLGVNVPSTVAFGAQAGGALDSLLERLAITAQDDPEQAIKTLNRLEKVVRGRFQNVGFNELGTEEFQLGIAQLIRQIELELPAATAAGPVNSIFDLLGAKPRLPFEFGNRSISGEDLIQTALDNNIPIGEEFYGAGQVPHYYKYFLQNLQHLTPEQSSQFQTAFLHGASAFAELPLEERVEPARQLLDDLLIGQQQAIAGNIIPVYGHPDILNGRSYNHADDLIPVDLVSTYGRIQTPYSGRSLFDLLNIPTAEGYNHENLTAALEAGRDISGYYDISPAHERTLQQYGEIGLFENILNELHPESARGFIDRLREQQALAAASASIGYSPALRGANLASFIGEAHKELRSNSALALRASSAYGLLGGNYLLSPTDYAALQGQEDINPLSGAYFEPPIADSRTVGKYTRGVSRYEELYSSLLPQLSEGRRYLVEKYLNEELGYISQDRIAGGDIFGIQDRAAEAVENAFNLAVKYGAVPTSHIRGTLRRSGVQDIGSPADFTYSNVGGRQRQLSLPLIYGARANRFGEQNQALAAALEFALPYDATHRGTELLNRRQSIVAGLSGIGAQINEGAALGSLANLLRVEGDVIAGASPTTAAQDQLSVAADDLQNILVQATIKGDETAQIALRLLESDRLDDVDSVLQRKDFAQSSLLSGFLGETAGLNIGSFFSIDQRTGRRSQYRPSSFHRTYTDEQIEAQSIAANFVAGQLGQGKSPDSIRGLLAGDGILGRTGVDADFFLEGSDKVAAEVKDVAGILEAQLRADDATAKRLGRTEGEEAEAAFRKSSAVDRQRLEAELKSQPNLLGRLESSLFNEVLSGRLGTASRAGTTRYGAPGSAPFDATDTQAPRVRQLVTSTDLEQLSNVFAQYAGSAESLYTSGRYTDSETLSQIEKLFSASSGLSLTLGAKANQLGVFEARQANYGAAVGITDGGSAREVFVRSLIGRGATREQAEARANAQGVGRIFGTRTAVSDIYSGEVDSLYGRALGYIAAEGGDEAAAGFVQKVVARVNEQSTVTGRELTAQEHAQSTRYVLGNQLGAFGREALGATDIGAASGKYQIRSGDTFNAIAAQHGITPDQLGALNPQIGNRSIISTGGFLNLPQLPGAEIGGSSAPYEHGTGSPDSTSAAATGQEFLDDDKFRTKIAEYKSDVEELINIINEATPGFGVEIETETATEAFLEMLNTNSTNIKDWNENSEPLEVKIRFVPINSPVLSNFVGTPNLVQ